MTTTLPIVFASLGKVVDLDPMTPLMSALITRLQQGIGLLDATRDLMGESGLLANAAARADLADLPFIRDALERLRSAGLILMEPGEKNIRFTTLSEQAQPIELALQASASREIVRGDAALSVSADAKLALTLTVLGPDKAEVIGLTLGSSDVLHQCRFGGHVGAAGSIEVARVAFGADVRAAAGVTWYFERHRQDTVMASLVDAAMELSQGACPWDLAQVRRVLEQPAQPGRHMDALRAIDVLAERRLRVSGELSVQRGFVGETSLPGANGPASIQLAAVAKASFRFSATRTGQFRVRLTREGSDILLDLTKARSQRQEREFKAGVEVGINGLDGLAQGWLDKLLPAIDDDLRGKLDQWSKPGAAFAARLRKELGKRWGEHLQPLAELVLGEVTAKEAADALSQQLIDRWAAMLDERIGVIGERAEVVAARLLNNEVAEGSLSAQAMAAIQAAVIKSITSLQSNIHAEVDTYVDGLQGRAADQLKALLSPLQGLGEKVEELVAAVDDKATKVVSAIEKLLKKYENLRKSLSTAAQKAAALKLGINFAATSSYETGESRQICVRFGPTANADAAKLFRRLVLGQGEIALDAIGALEAAGAGVRVEQGGFSAYAKRGRSISFSLDLFGLSFSDARILSSEVTIDVDASGRVRAFDSAATQTRVSNNPRTQQSATFSADFDLIAADSSRLPGTLGLGFELVGKKALSAKALSQFLGSFVDASLLAPDRAASAVERFEDDTSQPLAVSVTLNGLDSVMEKAALVPVETLMEEVLEDCVRFMRKRSDVAGRNIPNIPFDALFDWVQRAGSKSGADRAASETIHTILKDLSLETRLGGDLNRISREYRALYQASVCIPQTVRALAEIGKLAAATRSRALSDEESIAARARLDTMIQVLQRAATPAVDVSDSIYRYLSERLPDRTVALLAAIARLGANSDFRADVSLLPQ